LFCIEYGRKTKKREEWIRESKKMEESEYLRIAETIPLDWYTDEAAKEITSTLFYNIMIKTAEDNDLIINDTNDFQKLIKILAEKNKMPEDEALLDIKNVATTLGAVKLFELKYPQLVEQFPTDLDNRPQFPPKFLAKIMGVDVEVAENLLNGVLEEYKAFIR
jgi:hypothetical protein